MKISKIAGAIAAVTMAVNTYGVDIADATSVYDNTDTSAGDTTPFVGVSAIAIAADRCVIEAMQITQNFPALCIGNMDKVCAPSLSTSEVTGFLNGNWANANRLGAEAGAPFATVAAAMTNSGCATKTVLRRNVHGDGATTSYVDEALNTFIYSAPAGCGQGFGLASRTIAPAAATLTALNDTTDGKGDIGFVHAGDLDSTTYGDVGFIKLDGVAPSLMNLMSSNYNLVQNVYDSLPGVSKTTHGMIVGDSAASSAGGVGYHNIGGVPADCGPLSDSDNVRANGGPDD